MSREKVYIKKCTVTTVHHASRQLFSLASCLCRLKYPKKNKNKTSTLLAAFTAKKNHLEEQDKDSNGIPVGLLRWFQTVSSDNGKAVISESLSLGVRRGGNGE
jgi:hypothetical protein